MRKTVTAILPSMSPPEGVALKHYSPTIGTEIHGVDLSQPLGDDIFKFLNTMLVERKVIFFRDQDITKEEHLEFARHWGELETLPFLEYDDEHDELLTIRHGAEQTGRENVWHTDVSWREEPSLGSVLRAHKVPELGGDTLWCDMTAVYEALSPTMKEMIADLQVEYSVEAIARRSGGDVKSLLEEYPPPLHPVVRTHPESGRKILYVSRGHVKGIKGLGPEESRHLIEQLTSYASIPEFQCRFRWEPNSVAFWDNRSTQHYAVSDYAPAERFLDRVTIRGDRPV